MQAYKAAREGAPVSTSELGSGRPRAAMHTVMVVVGEALFIGLVCMALVLIFRDHFSLIYTSDVNLQHAVSKIAGLLGLTMVLNSVHGLTMVLNSVQPVLSGVAIGGGWQGLVAYINLGCYYVFGLPLGYLLCNQLDFGVGGIWSGMLCGVALQTLILLVVVWRTDWKSELRTFRVFNWTVSLFLNFYEAAQALSRVQKWGGKGTDEIKPLLEEN